MQNHLGSFECRLCLTLHNTEASYLAHTMGKKHQTNLQKRLQSEKNERGSQGQASVRHPRKQVIKIGRPGYKVLKQEDPETKQKSLLFELEFPEIAPRLQPRYRLMSSYE